MRAKAIMMPPSRGMAPPESPVPAPRPTKGTPNSLREFDERGDVLRWCAGRRPGRGVFVDAAVVLVEREVLGPVEIAARAEQSVHALLEGGGDHQIQCKPWRRASGFGGGGGGAWGGAAEGVGRTKPITGKVVRGEGVRDGGAARSGRFGERIWRGGGFGLELF